MKALVKEKPGPGLSLVELEKPRVEHPDDVLFRVVYCAICVGEMKVYEWNEWAASDPTLQLPTVLGHEAVGIVEDVGSAVRSFRPGDRVVNDPIIPCGHCRQCREGYPNMCEEREIYGKRRGAFAEYAVLPERVMCPLNERLSLAEGAVLENFGVAVHAIELVPHDPGDCAAVIGCGPIGILASQALAAWGVRVVMTDLSKPRLEMARAISRATAVVDVGREDPREAVAKLTQGRGADFVLEAAGVQAAWDQAFDLVRIRGTVATIGTFDRPISFNPFFRMTRKEIRLLSTMGRTWETWRRMNQLIDAGHVALRPLVTHILPLERYVEGFELVKSHSTMKVLLSPKGEAA